MKKTLKIITIILMTVVVLGTSAQIVFAADSNNSAAGIVNSISPDLNNSSEAAKDLTSLAGKVIGLIQIASAVAAVVLIAVFGFKFIIGSASEKADYQKSFIPLIVGIVVVFAATSIAKLLFGLIS